MQPVDHVLLEIDGLERYLSRRGFLKAVALLPILPHGISADDRRFLEGAARAVIPAGVLDTAGVDVVRNIEHLLARANADRRVRVLRALGWARRISFLYGGDAMPLRPAAPAFSLPDGWRLFGAENVYVADSSVFPSACGVNPSWTIMALARRMAFEAGRFTRDRRRRRVAGCGERPL